MFGPSSFFTSFQKRLQEKGWKVGDLLQAVLKYYEVMEKTSSEERCKSLFDWLLKMHRTNSKPVYFIICFGRGRNR